MSYVSLLVADAELGTDLLRSVRAAGYSAAQSPPSADSQEVARADAVLIDVVGPADLARIAQLRGLAPRLGIIALGSHAGSAQMVAALRCGADDLLRKPFDVAALERALANATRPREQAGEEAGYRTRDPRMQQVLLRLSRAAASDATIRIQGESGTGKDLLARWVHEHSRRRSGPFVVVPCAGLPGPLAESGLFGRDCSTFTTTIESRMGQLRASSGGTLVLDEICDLAPHLQSKLLRVLQEQQVTALGASIPEAVDLRVVATTQRELSDEVTAGRFREDLYYRLDVMEFRIPPLRERPNDIELLAGLLLDRFARQQGGPPPVLGEAALSALRQHPFRGNVRELENLMRRATLLFPGQVIDIDLLLSSRAGATPDRGALPCFNLRDLEREAIARSLAAHGGNRTHASRALGISVRTLRNKIHLYGLS